MADSLIASIAQNSSFVQKGLTTVYKDALPGIPNMFPAWLAEESQTDWIEREAMQTGFSMMPEKLQGGPFTYENMIAAPEKSHTLKSWGKGFAIEWELLQFKMYGVFGRVVPKMIRSGRTSQEATAYAMLNFAFVTTDSRFTIYNGEALCSTSHAKLRGGTGKNRATTAGTVKWLDMQEVFLDFRTMTDESGLPVQLTPSMLIVTPTWEWMAKIITRSEGRPGTANNDENVWKGFLSIHCTGIFLTNPDAWFVTASKKIMSEQAGIKFVHGLKMKDRSFFEPRTMNTMYTVFAIWNARVYSWLGVWGNSGS